MYSAYEIIKNFSCCNDCLRETTIAYSNDTNAKRNKTIFVNEALFKDFPFTFQIELRGVPFKGETTSELAQLFYEHFSKINTIETDIAFYTLESYIGNFENNGIDENGRLSLSTNFTVKNIKEEIK